jgi:hypothetical protein
MSSVFILTGIFYFWQKSKDAFLPMLNTSYTTLTMQNIYQNSLSLSL